MNSYLFGSGIPKFAVGDDEISVEKSFIENIELEPRDFEHESIINANKNWIEISHYDHIQVTVLCRLHKQLTNALAWFKNFYNTYNKTEVGAFFPSQTADAFVDETGAPVKFRLQIMELFPLETPWAYDTFRMIFRSKKPVNLGEVNVISAEGSVPMDTDGSVPMDTDGSVPTD